MDRRYIDEHNIIDRYLSRALSSQEQSEFEAYIIDKPDLLERVELGIMIKDAIDSGKVVLEKPAGSNNWFSNIFIRQLPLVAALGGVALIASVTTNIAQWQNTHQAASRGSDGIVAQANVPVVRLGYERSGSIENESEQFDRATRLTVRKNVKTAVLSIPLGIVEDPWFRLQIVEHPTNRLILEFDQVEPIGDAGLTVVFATNLFDDGNYLVKVSGNSTREMVFPMRVTIEE